MATTNTPAYRIAEQREISIPFRIGGAGQVMYTANEIESATSRLKALIGTTIGERVMRPGYGSQVNELLFDVNDPATEDMVITSIKEAVANFEPDIQLYNVIAEPSLDETSVSITVFFSKPPLPELYQAVTTITTEA